MDKLFLVSVSTRLTQQHVRQGHHGGLPPITPYLDTVY